MAEKQCGFCSAMVAADQKICPECGFDFEPKPAPEKVELTDAQIAALAGFQAAKYEQDEYQKDSALGAGQAKMKKFAMFVMVWVVIPAVVGIAAQRMHLIPSGEKMGATLQEQRANRDAVEADLAKQATR